MGNFADDPQAMLELGLIERNTKRPITEWLEVKDKAAAFDFEKAVTLRLLVYDNDRDKANAQKIAKETTKGICAVLGIDWKEIFGDDGEENSEM